MIYPSIRIEGAILSPDILDRLEDLPGQKPVDFGLDSSARVKDEIARAWADAQDYWRIFQRRMANSERRMEEDGPSDHSPLSTRYSPLATHHSPLTTRHSPSFTTETRQQWVTPLLGLLGYQIEYQARGVELNGKLYSISHRAVNRALAPVQIVGYREPAGLDRKPERANVRMSAHAVVQEFINLNEQLYGLVTNGRVLRLLRDSSRLIKLSYLEFDLDRIFTDGLFADFAVLYRLLHASRLPVTNEAAAESWIERYHQDSLDSGTRIRDGLSRAVEQAIRDFGNGFLSHPANDALRRAVAAGELSPEDYYKHLLRLIYRLLFLMVIEERDLVFPPKEGRMEAGSKEAGSMVVRGRIPALDMQARSLLHAQVEASQREIYRRYYSVQRLRLLSEKRYLADPRRHDLWLALLSTFRLFEADGPGEKLGLAPLAGDLFGRDAIGPLAGCTLGNDILLGCLRSLSLYEHPENRQLIRVNYAALNVEEFGSVYEGLLEYEPIFIGANGERRVASGKWRGVRGTQETTAEAGSLLPAPSKIEFGFTVGNERSVTGSHYTPDDLVQPLIKHSLDYLIAERLAEARRMASGEWQETFREVVYEFLSGPRSVAAGDGLGHVRLLADEILSKRRVLRPDQPDTPSGQFDSRQHRRGMGAAEPQGVPAFPEHGQRQLAGTGNPSHPQSAGGHSIGSRSSTSTQRDIDSGTSNPLPPPRTLSEGDLTALWRELPIAARHSLLATQALLSLRVADIACGSGHILLAAARRIATELAVVRTGEEQPSPSAYRAALRDVIRTCIYGVDLNPLAVELCKVALWLEAHNPGQPLNFLDHHIKCGNAIVGFVRREDVDQGVPNEAFATLPGDDKEVAARWRKKNKKDREEHVAGQLRFAPAIQQQLDAIIAQWSTLSALPERTPAEITEKKARFVAFAESRDAWLLNQIAAIPISQFYIPKTPENDCKLITDEPFRRYWMGAQTPQGQATAMAWATAHEKRFFHWFLEFPDVMAGGGFDCILGNPPYLGRGGIRSTYGDAFCTYVQWEFAPAGISDLVVFFVRRIHELLRDNGFTAFITTNSIRDGEIRKDGLEQLVSRGASINFAVRGIKWPGRANLVISLIAIHKGAWYGRRLLDGSEVPVISAHLDDTVESGTAQALFKNADRVYQGSIFLGDGFLLDDDEVDRLLGIDPRNREVICRVINGQELNNRPEQEPGRSIINFRDWPLERAATYPAPCARLEALVKPDRVQQGNPDKWWQFWRPRVELYQAIRSLPRCFVAARTTKHLNFSAAPTNYVFTDALYVFTTDRWDLYAVVQSTLHEVWARKYSGALETRLRYSPSDCFETFAFPEGLLGVSEGVSESGSRRKGGSEGVREQEVGSSEQAYPHSPTPLLATRYSLASIGERYHEHRSSLMLSLWLGLTDIYNLFHTRDLSPAKVAKVSKKPEAEAERGYQGLLELRRLHLELDLAVRDAYGWQDLDLGHDFHEVETLPENDRVRYTISPAARKEVLKHLLALNHARAQAEAAAGPAKLTRARRTKKDGNDGGMFS